MKVSDILKTKKRAGEVLSVSDSDLASVAVAKMVENDTGSVVVYGDKGSFVGMLTFREVLIALQKNGYEAGAGVRCGDIADIENRVWASPDDSIDQIRNLMTSRHIRYLPVMQGEKLTDIVSFYDVARSIVKAANFENKLLKEYIRNWPEQTGE